MLSINIMNMNEYTQVIFKAGLNYVIDATNNEKIENDEKLYYNDAGNMNEIGTLGQIIDRNLSFGGGDFTQVLMENRHSLGYANLTNNSIYYYPGPQLKGGRRKSKKHKGKSKRSKKRNKSKRRRR